MEKRKILILYAPLGAGHGAAARAIAEAFSLKYPDIEVKNINVLDFAFDIFRQGFPWAFYFITFNVPFFYKWLYNYYNYQSRSKFLNHASEMILKKSRFVKFINDFNPNFIISTNPLPMQLVSKTKQKNVIDILSANVCTDFGFHSFWYNPDVNYYFVANDRIKNSLLLHNVIPESVKITGIPISLKFSKKIDRQKILSDLKFSSSQPVLLILGGKIICRNLLKVVKGIKEKNHSTQFIIVASRDKNLQKELKKSKINNDPSVRLFDFVNNLDEYMTAADLVFTKAGGLTVAESLAKGLPMIINDIIPGQEQDNVNYLVSHRAGIKVKSIEEIIDNVIGLFNQPDKLMKMKENCLKIAKPNAAVELADFVISLFQETEL